ncbi:hypothetical protein, partial [Salmonella enterica]|uniref:hypothetical protein n=1 Tax=Salmonella enterica TaxID=28901 RepID=UPI0021579F75
FWCGLSGAPGCVTWELILDGYSESSYSATPRFAAARLPWFDTTMVKPCEIEKIAQNAIQRVLEGIYKTVVALRKF